MGERVHELERELETARRDAAQRASLAAKVGALERDLRIARAERDEMRVGLEPSLTRQRWIFLGVGALGLSMLGAVSFFQASVSQTRIARCEDRNDELEREVRAASEETQRALDRAARAESVAAVPPAPPLPASLPPPPRPEIARLHAVGHVVSEHGIELRSDARCTIDVHYEPGSDDCHAAVDCGETNLYARGGGGFFRCETRDGRIVRGRDVNPTNPSNDPAFDLDVERGTIIVSDESPTWSVTIALPPPSPF